MRKIAYVDIQHQDETKRFNNLNISMVITNNFNTGVFGDEGVYLLHINEDIPELPDVMVQVRQFDNEKDLIEEYFNFIKDSDMVIYHVLDYDFNYIVHRYRELGGNVSKLLLGSDDDIEDTFKFDTLKISKVNGIDVPLPMDRYKYKYNIELPYSMHCFIKILNNKGPFTGEKHVTTLSVLTNKMPRTHTEIEDKQHRDQRRYLHDVLPLTDHGLLGAFNMFLISNHMCLLEKYFRAELTPLEIYEITYKQVLNYLTPPVIIGCESLREIELKATDLSKQLYVTIYDKQKELLKDTNALVWNNNDSYDSYSSDRWLRIFIITKIHNI